MNLLEKLFSNISEMLPVSPDMGIYYYPTRPNIIRDNIDVLLKDPKELSKNIELLLKKDKDRILKNSIDFVIDGLTNIFSKMEFFNLKKFEPYYCKTF